MRALKKYPNRRLYDLTDSKYVTVEDVRKLILKGDSIKVEESKDGTDITRAVLLPIADVNRCGAGSPLLTQRRHWRCRRGWRTGR